MKFRYDVGRAETGGPAEVTSTGMNTFGLAVGEQPTGYEEVGRPPRRLAAVSVFAALAIVGAAGSYFVVVSGLGSLLREKPPAAPATAGEQPADAGTTAHRATPARAAAPAVPGTAATAASPAAIPPAIHVRPAQRRTAPEQAARPTGTPCACRTPPVPTPTAVSASPGDWPGEPPGDSPGEPPKGPLTGPLIGPPSPSATPNDTDGGDPSVSPDPSERDDHGHSADHKEASRGY